MHPYYLHNSPIRSKSAASSGDLWLWWANIHGLRSDEDGSTALRSENGASRTSEGGDMGDAERVICS